MTETISLGSLRERLERGEKLTVLDVRDKDDYAEWRIPGSTHINAWDELSQGQVDMIRKADLPKDRPIVTVCYAGNTSRMAAQVLRERGFDAVSLAGGMNAWSLAWNTADVALPGSAARIVQVRRTGKGCLSYIIASAGQAAIIDPSVEVSVYAQIAKENNWRITRVLETHVHADHLSRANALVAATGATLDFPRTNRISYAHKEVDEGSHIRVGDVTLTAIRTPGHTRESTCYLLEGANGSPSALFTGDTLFLDAVGRPDLEADKKEATERATALHASLQRLIHLPDNTLVLPCHTDEPTPFDEKPIVAPLREVRKQTPALALSREALVARVTQNLPPPPANHHLVVQANEAGETEWEDPTHLEAGANRCAAR